VQEVVPRFRNAPGKINWLGKHEVGTETRDFLREAGYADGDIAALEKRGIIKAA
jgi:crotonobetainyl-CoA:carnitine CoA-transferase CaiB-like acyl-CoA transferase